MHGRGYQFVAEVAETEERARRAPVVERAAPPQQEIRFCTASDGVRLAYATMGNGPPLVKVANWLSHLDYDWESPVWRHWLVELSRRFTLVRYDERGCGLSDWDLPQFSFEEWVDDLETVVDAAGLDRFPLLGISQGGPVAIAYAVRHPERVSHLVVFGSYVQGLRKRAKSQDELELVEAYIDVIRLGWGRPDRTYRQIIVSKFPPGRHPGGMAGLRRASATDDVPENAWRFVNEFADIDVTDLAPRVTVPTLVIGGRRDQVGPFEQSRLVAGLIPGSRLVPLDTPNHLLPER